MFRRANRPTADVTDTDRRAVCQTVQVAGMTCRHCELAVTAELERIPAVTHVAVDLAAGTVTFEANELVAPAAIASAIEEAGYEVVR